MAGRVPPHNLNAERSVLGAMMLETEAVARAVERLHPEDFYYQNNARIFAAMAGLFGKGQPVDFVTLTDALEKEGVMEAVGGYDYISSISTFLPSAAHVGEYIKIVEDRSVLRRLIRVMAELTEDCYAASKDVEQILQEAEKAIFGLSQSKHTRGLVSIQEAIDQVLDQIQVLSEEGSAVTGLKSFNALDNWLAGLHPSELILVAARPSMGKTALELNIARQVALRNDGATIALFSLEMPCDQIAARMLSDVGPLPLANIRTGQIDDFSKLWEAAAKLGRSSIYIDDTPGISVMEIRSKCRRLKLEKGLSLVGIDYLQLISGAGSGRSENRQQEVSEITRALKIMARELNVPVLLLSQLSRAPERRDNHRPMLADLRESGAIEQDADVVMFLYREAYYADEKQGVDAAQLSNIAEVKIAKNRNGPTGTVKLTWDAATASYRDMDTRYEEPLYGA
ncbi:MAG: replicative DNA helicase [Clostridiales bacterium]|nr:replicative DNA helicase [Clostridiales bacterium]